MELLVFTGGGLLKLVGVWLGQLVFCVWSELI